MGAIKLILVDDHKMIREGLKNFLVGNADFEVLGEAENGQLCLDLLKEVEPDVVITDFNMPEMNGLELAKKINIEYPDIRVIA